MAITGLNALQKQFVDAFNLLTHKHNGWQVWEDFVTMSACAISNRIDQSNYEQREQIYMDRIKRYDSKDAQAFPQLLAITVAALDHDPEQDFLGALFQLLELSNHWRGQFFTPYPICRMMAEMQFVALPDKNCISVNDPACGAGATLIAFANVARARGFNYQQRVLFVGQDIDHTAAMMCYIQLSLLGCPGYVIVGDTLRHPPTEPMPKDYEIWYTPMYCSDVWRWRRLFKGLDDLWRAERPPVVPEEQPEPVPEIAPEPVVEPVPVPVLEEMPEGAKVLQLTLF